MVVRGSPHASGEGWGGHVCVGPHRNADGLCTAIASEYRSKFEQACCPGEPLVGQRGECPT